MIASVYWHLLHSYETLKSHEEIISEVRFQDLFIATTSPANTSKLVLWGINKGSTQLLRLKRRKLDEELKVSIVSNVTVL